jgi:hypothetical protein
VKGPEMGGLTRWNTGPESTRAETVWMKEEAA